MINAFADFIDELQLDDIDSEGNKDFDEIHLSVLLEVVDNITQELAGSFPDSLLVRLQMWFPCVCHTAQLGVKDFLENNLGHRGQIKAIVAKAQCFITSAKNSTKCAEVFSEKNFNSSTMNKTRWSSMYKMLMSIISTDDRNLLKELPN